MRTPLLRDSTPFRPYRPCTILRYPFLVTDPKIFLKAPSVPIYTNFEGGLHAEKTQFFGKIFQKVPKNAYFGLFFFKILPVAQKYRPKQGLCSGLGELRKSINQFSRPKKKVDKTFEVFFENPHPLDKILDPCISVLIFSSLNTGSVQRKKTDTKT